MAFTEKTGTVVTSSKNATTAFASVLVSEAAPIGNVEYQAETPLQDQAGRNKTLSQLRADIAAHVRAQRIAQLGSPPESTGVTGTLDV